MNTFGNRYRLTSFGESHGPAMGGVIDGLPSGYVFNFEEIQEQLNRRRPGQSVLTTARNEGDRLQILSGIMGFDPDADDIVPLTADCKFGISLGTPVGFMIANSDSHSSDYDELRHVFRPSHADYAWHMRYGVRDWRGGGRSSGRETVSRVVAGAFARQILAQREYEITSKIESINGVHNPTESQIAAIVLQARNEADSVGGVVECRIKGIPPGVGEPTFGKLQQMLASAMLSIGAVKGFEYGMGFEGVQHRGSEVVDEFRINSNGYVCTTSNHSGGIQGGLSNGQDIVFRVAVKPTPSLARELKTVNDALEETELTTRGRHDPSILMRVPVVVESMAAMVILDALLMRNANL